MKQDMGKIRDRIGVEPLQFSLVAQNSFCVAPKGRKYLLALRTNRGMNSVPPENKPLKRQDGVALIAVIFLLIVIGALGIAISNVMQNQASQVGLTLTVNCADYAGAAGARFGSQQIQDGSYTGGAFPITPAITPLYTLPDDANLSLAKNRCANFALSCLDNICSTVIGIIP